MNNVSNINEAPSKLAAADKAKQNAVTQALAVLEQMYGYFSFEPMPLEAKRQKAA